MNRVRLALCVLMFCGLSVTGMAQEDRTTPVVTAAAPADKVRFAGSPSAVQMRIEVRSAGGALVYDSDWKDGNIFDWVPRESSAQPLALGAYRLVMRSKNLAGQTSEKEVALRVDSGGMTVADQPSASPKITLTAHDGETGQLITTSGDLSFRFGDFLNRKDAEAMRLTAAGELTVGGLIHAKGIMFSDGSILTTGMATVGDGGGVIRQRPSPPSTSGTSNREKDGRQRILLLNPPAVSAPRLTPRPNFAPAFQFLVGNSGVSVGTTNPAYRLDVTGIINANDEYDIGGAPFVISPGQSQTFLGPYAGNLTMSGLGGNTASGTGALAGNTTGWNNTASGVNALANNGSGYDNTAIGVAALNINTTGQYNTASGSFSLSSNTDGNGNTAVGTYALANNTATGNTAIGFDALIGNAAGCCNTATGEQALNNNSAGNYNTANGDHALYHTTGSGNIAVGGTAGQNLTTGDNNIDIGNLGVASEAGIIRIGTGGTHTKTFIAGISGVTTGLAAVPVLIDANGQLGTASSSRRYKFDINSLDASTDGLMRLRPVTFRYLAQGDNAPLQYGLIAEEVAEVYPEMVTRNKDGEVETVMYQFLAPMLLNEVQKEHRQIEEQQKTIDALNTTLARVMQRVEQLEGKRIAQ
jgi:hypothetical protein